MTSIGETLRRERLQKGLDLQQVSATTKIGTRMLQAMEQDDFSKLPGGVFTRSFIKQYAVALGINPDSLDQQLGQLQTETEEPQKNAPRKDVISDHERYTLSDYNSSRSSNSLLMSLVWVVLAALVGGAVYYAMNRPPAASPPRAEAPAPKKPIEETAPATPSAPTLDHAVSSAAQPAVAPPGTPDASAPASPLQLVLTAKEKAWVSISADGKSQYVGDMQLDEKRTIQANQRIKLIAGNAGGLEIELNGKSVDAIGPKGQVRVVEFTPDGVHVVPRTPKPAPLP